MRYKERGIIMKELELLGKRCKDIVSGLEGICIGVVEWMYGGRQFVLQPKAEGGMKRHYSSFYFEKQLEVLDDGVADKIEIPEYRQQEYFGKECRDKVTGVIGMCIGRAIWLFNCDQYVLEIQPEDHAKDSRLLWLDDGRVEVTAEQEKSIQPEEITGTRAGGIMDSTCYPDRNEIMFSMMI